MVCREEAVVRLPSHNAKFCAHHFDQFFLRQVDKAIRKFKMLSEGAKVVVAVSGGKDSLAVADALSRLGFEVVGFHIDLGIAQDEFSRLSLEASRQFFAKIDRPLAVYSVLEKFGKPITEVVQGFKRPCAVCGLTKRHIMNEFASRQDAQAIATGHHLDDLTGALLANVLRWDVRYLQKTLPVLPAKDGFAKKIKPLALVAEEEVRTYVRLRGIQYVSLACPFSKDARFKRLRALLDQLESESPGTKRSFYETFLRVAHVFSAQENGRQMVLCRSCGLPAASDPCAFCRLWGKTLEREPQ
ncbi:MAG: TIGR00269 family protein [Bacillota bacterium]